MASLGLSWTALLVLVCCAVGADAAYIKRYISELDVGNGTIRLQLTTGEGYLNAVGGDVSFIRNIDDTSAIWHVEEYIVGGLDQSVYIKNIATGKYLTKQLLWGGIEVAFLDVFRSRWYFYEIDNTGVYKIGSAYSGDYYVSFTGSNSQDGASSFNLLKVLPPPPPPPPPSPPPPPPQAASIQALQFPHVFLHIDDNQPAADGVGKLVNLQYSLDSSTRFILEELKDEGSSQQEAPVVGIVALRNSRNNLYVRLDPTVLPGQEPEPGSTFHANGVGRTSAVPEIDKWSKFEVLLNLPNDAQPSLSFSFRLLNPNPELPHVYLRFDGKGVVDGKPGGVVNGQTYISDFERLVWEY